MTVESLAQRIAASALTNVLPQYRRSAVADTAEHLLLGTLRR